MIKIIKGTYGYVGKNGIPTPKTSNDEPFSVSAEEEQRLIALGVAEHVDDKAEPKKEEPKVEPKAEPKKAPAKKSNKKKANNKKETAKEEPPAFDAVDPE